MAAAEPAHSESNLPIQPVYDASALAYGRVAVSVPTTV